MNEKAKDYPELDDGDYIGTDANEFLKHKDYV